MTEVLRNCMCFPWLILCSATNLERLAHSPNMNSDTEAGKSKRKGAI
jgi:hypothetical protein